MNKIALSVLALAAFATASYAAERRSYELRDIEPYPGDVAVMTETAPLAMTDSVAGLSAYERQLLLAEQNEMGGR